MSGCKPIILSLFVSAVWLGVIAAQPLKTKPPSVPLTQKEKDRLEAFKLFGWGRMCEHDDRLFESLNAYEKAAKLDPEASPIFKALIPLYMGLGRSEAALKASKKVVELDPSDYKIWYLYGRQLRTEGKTKEAKNAFEKAVGIPECKKYPELQQQIYYELGKLHELAGQPLQAIAAFRQTVTILERDDTFDKIQARRKKLVALRTAELYERIGKLYLQVEQYDDAAQAYQTAQQRYPEGAGRIHLNLARVRLKQNQQRLALKHLDDYLRFQPQGLEAYEMKIDLLRTLGQSQTVLPWLKQASNNDQHHVGLKFLLAKQLVKSGRSTEAEAILKKLGEVAPSVEVYRQLFRLYQKDARLGVGKAVLVLNDAVAKAKEKDLLPGGDLRGDRAQSMLLAVRDDEGLAKEMVRAGLQLIKNGKDLAYHTEYILGVLANQYDMNDEAERFYRNCLANRVTPRTAVSVYSGLIDVLWHMRKHEEIVRICNNGLRSRLLTGSHLLFYYNRGLAHARLGRFDLALRDAKSALDQATEPQRLTVLRLKVRILSMAERYNEAIAECQNLLKTFNLPGEKLQIHYIMSGIYSSQKDYPKAEAELALVLKMDPDYATAYNDLGYLWADQGKNLKKAEAYIRKAIALTEEQGKNPGPNAGKLVNAAYVDSLGWVLFRLGEVDAARRELERATSLPHGDDPVIWDHLGDVYFRLLEHDHARRAWEKAAELLEAERVPANESRLKTIRRKLQILEETQQP